MITIHKLPVRVLIAAILAGMMAFAFQSPGKIEVEKMNATALLVDKYSYMAQPYSFYYFHHIDELGFRTDPVRRGGQLFPLKEPTAPFSPTYKFDGQEHTLEEYFNRNFATGFLVLRDDQIVCERYFHGADRHSRFVSQSVGKSILSILVGIAVDEKKIGSVNDLIVKYLPELSESAYREVTIKQALQMSTGVDYSEDYRDPKSGAARIGAALLTGSPSFKEFVASMRPSAVRPGTAFHYQSVNTQALGLLLEQVTRQPLNTWAQDKLWNKIGAQSDAFFYESKKQANICAFACFNATLRDYGRIGLLMLNNGMLGGRRILSSAWVKESTAPDARFLEPKPGAPGQPPEPGYAYQWWVPEKGVFMALGIYGQIIYVNPARRLVMVQTSAWPEPIRWPLVEEQQALINAIADRNIP